MDACVWATAEERVEGVRERKRHRESCTAVRPGLGSGQWMLLLLLLSLRLLLFFFKLL